jgi:hypothetical protein
MTGRGGSFGTTRLGNGSLRGKNTHKTALPGRAALGATSPAHPSDRSRPPIA